jgi:hypothetical protein
MNGRVHSQDLLATVLCAIGYGALLQVAAAFSLPLIPVGIAGLLLIAALAMPLLRERRAAAGTALPESDPVTDVSASTAIWLLSLVVVVALATRLHTFMDRPAWDDEMWTLRNMYTSDWGELLRVAFDDYWPPLHYVVLNVVARVADTSILWLRLPSVIFGVVAVAAMYPLGMLLFRNRAMALVGSAMFAGMTTHVLFSQEARVYAMQVLLVVLTAFFFYRSFWERRIAPAFVLTAVLLTYTHSFSSWYFLAGLSVYVLVAALIWKDREAFLRGFASMALVLLLWLPLVAAFVWARFRREIVVPTYWATGEDRLPGVFDLIEQYQGLAVRSWAGAAFMVLFIALAIALAWRELNTQERSETRASGPPGNARAVVFLICWITVPVLFSLAVSVGTSMKTFGAIRYHMAVLPGICLLATAGFAALRYRTMFAVAAAIVVLLPLAELPRYYRDFTQTREAHDQAAALVREHGTEEERIYVGNGFRVFGYYYRGSFPRIGSAEWDSLASAHAHLTDRRTLESAKWGDTYAYEKLSPKILFYGYYQLFEAPTSPERYDRFIRDELARGGFQGSFWLILDARGKEFFEPVLSAAGIACRSPLVFQVPGLELRRCNPPAAADPPADPSVTLLQKSDEKAGSRIASSDSHSG